MEMAELYNKHYIRTDARSSITDGWSNGPHPERDTTGAVCISEQGGYQFRLSPDGEQNPPLYTMDGIPLYRWDGEAAVRRCLGILISHRRSTRQTGKLCPDLTLRG